MAKLKNFQAYKTENTPDFIMQEIEDLTKDMAEKLKPLIERRSGNIVLAAMNFLNAGLHDDRLESNCALQTARRG